ncbi:cytochrome P450 [Xylaria cf. heliscus]|nr:cytochrome P450 [Xylaria cf. heliscus]
MAGFEWQEQRGVEGTGFVRALRSLLTSHLPYYRVDLEKVISQSLSEELSQVGEDGRNKEFTAAALEFPQIVILTAEVMRITPKFLRGRHSAARTLRRFLEPIVHERLQDRIEGNSSKPVPIDCMQWLIDTSPQRNPWSPARMIGEIMAIWFSSVHQLAMTVTYVVEDLCLHEEYVDPLRQEIEKQVTESGEFRTDLEGLALLDSFIKESIRHSNVDAISCRRKALRDVTLQDGSVVKEGDWVCIPQRAMMHDSSRYANPEIFDGRRFASANAMMLKGQLTNLVPDKETSSLTTTSIEWPIWGLGNTAW